MYTIEVLRARSRVILSFCGEMKQDPAAFFAELTAAANTAKLRDGEWEMLVDFSQTPVMPQDRAQNTARIFDWCLANGIRKTACVMTMLTQRMQIQRVTKRHEKIECFEDSQSAEEWLAQ